MTSRKQKGGSPEEAEELQNLKGDEESSQVPQTSTDDGKVKLKAEMSLLVRRIITL